MNSLTELNGYASALSFDFTDNRNANVTFDRSTGTAQSAIIDEGFALTTPIGIEITEIINSDVSAPTYTINVSAVAGTTVTWASLPTGVTASTPSTGVYRLSGIKTKAHWDAVKVATVTPPSNYNGIFSYTSTIAYYSQEDGNQTKSWITTLTVNDVVFLTSPLEFTYPSSATTTIANTTQIVNVDATYPGATWTIVATPSTISSVTTFTTTGTGGTFSVNSSTKVITISGTRAQVNSRLAGLQITSNSTSVDFSITYALSNNQNSTTDSAIQIMKSQGLIYLGAVTVPTIYFTEDAASQAITGVPLITDSAYDGSGQYTFTVTPSTTSAIASMTTSGTEGSASFNSSTKVLTVLGTRSQINTRLLTLSIRTAVDWATDFTLSYTVSTPRVDVATKLQILACGSNDTEVTNMNVTRSYFANRQNTIFSSDIPYISDFDTTEGNNYTISFSSALGLFGFASETPVSTLTFTGTKAQCNAKFTAVRFWPNAGVSSNGTFTYTQQKNSVQQVNQNVSLTGTAASYNNARSFIFTSSQNYTPTYEDLTYGNFEIVLIGGGGGGGTFGGTGGCAGQVLSASNVSLTNQTYNIIIGSGGAGGIAGVPFVSSPIDGVQGQSTTAFGYTAIGGYGGTTAANVAYDNVRPQSGNGFLTGLSYFNGYYNRAAGGGGAGSTSDGADSFPVGLAPNDTPANGTSARGGVGGSPTTFTWDYSANSMYGYYAGGGAGGHTTSTVTPRTAPGQGNTITYPSSVTAGKGGNDSINPTSANPNSGSGGGGGGNRAQNGANGGSGVVGVRITSK